MELNRIKVAAMLEAAEESLEPDVDSTEAVLAVELKHLGAKVRAKCRKAFMDASGGIEPNDEDDMMDVFSQTFGVKALQALELFSDRFGNGEYDKLIEELGDYD